MNTKKIYCGNGRKKSDTWLKVSLDVSELLRFTKTGKNGRNYANVDINIMPQANKWGNDVSVSIDTWQPPAKDKTPGRPEVSNVTETPIEGDLPF